MTRNKKRILKKKQVKKQIKKKPVTNNKPTSDQQSRQNEMLKVMLSKQPQINYFRFARNIPWSNTNQ